MLGGSWKGLVDGIFERLTWSEFRNFGCLDFDRFAGSRITSDASGAVADFEGAKSDQGDALFFLEAAFDRRQGPFQRSAC